MFWIWDDNLNMCRWPCEGEAGKYHYPDDGQLAGHNSKPREATEYKGQKNVTSLPKMVCDETTKCQIDISDVQYSGINNSAWAWWTWSYGKYTGQACNPQDDLQEVESDKPNKESCAGSGKVLGQINGVDVCVLPDFSSGTKTETTEHPDGTKTEVIEYTEKDWQTGDTKTTTTTNQYDSNGNLISSSTTTTTKTGNGLGGGNGEGEGGGWGGTCDAWQCAGDAIQCAIAKAEWDRNCYFKVSDDVEKDGKRAMEDGFYDADDPRKPENIREEEVSKWDTSGGFSSRGLDDVHISVFGQTLTLPFSQYNRYFDIIGKIMILCAWIIAFRIVQEAA